MWRGVAIGAVAIAIAGSLFVYARAQTYAFPPAQSGAVQPVPPGTPQGTFARWQMSADDLNALAEARLAALKAGLVLTPEQEKNWPAFEQAARDLAKLRREFREARRNAQPAADPAERLRRRAIAMADTGAALKKLADTIEPLYKSLDDNQKRRFGMLSRFGRWSGGMGFEFRGPDRDGMEMHHRGGGRRGMMMERDQRDRMGERDDRHERNGMGERQGRDDGDERL
jgi:zinc resistance-associated protein